MLNPGHVLVIRPWLLKKAVWIGKESGRLIQGETNCIRNVAKVLIAGPQGRRGDEIGVVKQFACCSKNWRVYGAVQVFKITLTQLCFPHGERSMLPGSRAQTVGIEGQPYPRGVMPKDADEPGGPPVLCADVE